MCGDLSWQLEKVDLLENWSQNEWKRTSLSNRRGNLIYELLGRVESFLDKTEIISHLHNHHFVLLLGTAREIKISTVKYSFSTDWQYETYIIFHIVPDFWSADEKQQQKNETI